MPTILLVDKSGLIKEQTIKDCSSEELYKKAKFKSGDGFECHTTWTISRSQTTYSISLYGKSKGGKAGQENKYEFPPPQDKTLFFGNCLLLNRKTPDSDKIDNLSLEEWEDIYEELHGGFEDITHSEGEGEEEEEEKDEYALLPTTRNGYAKDGFVVDDDEEEDEEYEPPPPPKSKKAKRKSPSKKREPVLKPEEEVESLENELVCSDELEEEEYMT